MLIIEWVFAFVLLNLLCLQEIDESRVSIDMHDESFVSLRRLMFELQRNLKSAAINNNVLLKHLEGSIQNKVLPSMSFVLCRASCQLSFSSRSPSSTSCP